MALDKNKILRGNFGKVWINNEYEVAEVKSFEAKVTFDFEEVDIIGEMGKEQRLMGYQGAGTMIMHKINSRIINLISENINKGILPEIKIIAKLADPGADGEERVLLTGVTLDEITVLAFKNKELREEEVPFKFAKYKMIDTID